MNRLSVYDSETALKDGHASPTLCTTKIIEIKDDIETGISSD